MILVLMTNPNSIQTETAAAKSSRKLITTSSDGKWETYLQYAGLMRYVPSGVFFARFKIAGKLCRESLETDVKTTAIDLLAVKRQEWRKPQVEVGTFAVGRARFDFDTANRRDLSDEGRVYRNRCVKAIVDTWTGVEQMHATDFTDQSMQSWAKRFHDKYNPVFCNGALNVFREILVLAGLPRDKEKNPAFKVKRLGVKPKQLDLPTKDQFAQVIYEMRHSGAATCKANSELATFFSLTGARKKESWRATWKDVNFDANEITLWCLKRRTASQERLTRTIPMVPALRAFLEQLKADYNPKPEDNICKVKTCDEALTAACKKVGCQRLTHHDLRHLFATWCIEAGVDIPTVSRWLGHSDGGVLAMKTYGHLRREHSQAMAKRITFDLQPVQPVKQLTEITL